MSYYLVGAALSAKPTLRQGAKGAFVMELQSKLGVAVDAIFGPATAGAVRTFQKARGLMADGVVGPLTWAALDRTASPPAKPVTHSEPVLRPGSDGAAVIDVQQRLGTVTDGLYGPNTKKAVAAFQASHGLEVDGIVGPQTWAALSTSAPPTSAAPGAKAVAETPPAGNPKAVTVTAPEPAPQPAKSGSGGFVAIALGVLGVGGFLLSLGRKRHG